MKIDKLKKSIETIWAKRDKLRKLVSKKDLNVINETLDNLDKGKVRVAEKIKNKWILNQWVKKAVLLSFQVTDQKLIPCGPGKTNWLG